jgi:hypothetical protein
LTHNFFASCSKLLLIFSPSYSWAQTIFLSDDDKPKETADVVLHLPTFAIEEKNSQEEVVVKIPAQDALEKIIGAPKCRKKMTHTTSVSLEAHQGASSSSHVSTPCALLVYGANRFYLCMFVI